MKRNINTLIITMLTAGILLFNCGGAEALNLNFIKKKDSKAQKEKTVKIKVKKVKPKKEDLPVKEAKPNLLEKHRIKKAEKKEKQHTVTAKTDKKQMSTAVAIPNIKEENDPKKTKKVKNKKVKNKKVKDENIKDTVNKEAEKKENKDVKQESAKELAPLNSPKAKQDSQDVFSPAQKVEGGVETNKIISVDDCVKIALQNNPSILSQMVSKDIYKNKIAQAWSNYFPTLSAGAAYSKNDMLMTNFNFPMQTYNLWNTPNIGFNQLIYDFGKTRAQAGVAKKTYEASENALQSSVNEVVYAVKNSYYNLLYLQQQVEVYEDSVLQYQVHLKQAQAYYDIGSKAKIDVSTAAYNLDNTKLTLINSKNSVDNAFAQLTNAMGIPDFAQFSIKDRLDKKKYNVTFEDAINIAYEQNPNLIVSKKKMEGSRLLIKSSKVAFLPDIKGFGTYTRGGGKPNGDYGYQIGAQIAYSNINLLLLKEQIDEAHLTYQKDKADYEVQRQKIYLDVKQAYIQLRNAQQSIPVARSSMNVAKEQYDLASGRYKVGMGNAVELKDAENTYRTAKMQYYNTLMQYHINAANLERVVGAPLTASDESL